MDNHSDGLSPYASTCEDLALRNAIDAFWNVIRTLEDIGETTWEALEELERGVTECCYQDPPDYERAMSLTRKAEILIAGLDDL